MTTTTTTGWLLRLLGAASSSTTKARESTVHILKGFKKSKIPIYIPSLIRNVLAYAQNCKSLEVIVAVAIIAAQHDAFGSSTTRGIHTSESLSPLGCLLPCCYHHG